MQLWVPFATSFTPPTTEGTLLLFLRRVAPPSAIFAKGSNPERLNHVFGGGLSGPVKPSSLDLGFRMKGTGLSL